ncbi:hypothetical protein [Nocardia sp. CDC160]|uniref:hypothetical protein n=1 Tax=Nocardia sp. CDC160 TaxID=3112166 RepID=UPI002DB62CD1|nr:hypothetical protein [Nocardia sp. CDC160]MEC3920297.1 hypothetical protein [Nocardia sp. CDC160]
MTASLALMPPAARVRAVAQTLDFVIRRGDATGVEGFLTSALQSAWDALPPDLAADALKVWTRRVRTSVFVAHRATTVFDSTTRLLTVLRPRDWDNITLDAGLADLARKFAQMAPGYGPGHNVGGASGAGLNGPGANTGNGGINTQGDNSHHAPSGGGDSDNWQSQYDLGDRNARNPYGDASDNQGGGFVGGFVPGGSQSGGGGGHKGGDANDPRSRYNLGDRSSDSRSSGRRGDNGSGSLGALGPEHHSLGDGEFDGSGGRMGDQYGLHDHGPNGNAGLGPSFSDTPVLGGPFGYGTGASRVTDENDRQAAEGRQQAQQGRDQQSRGNAETLTGIGIAASAGIALLAISNPAGWVIGGAYVFAAIGGALIVQGASDTAKGQKNEAEGNKKEQAAEAKKPGDSKPADPPKDPPPADPPKDPKDKGGNKPNPEDFPNIEDAGGGSGHGGPRSFDFFPDPDGSGGGGPKSMGVRLVHATVATGAGLNSLAVGINASTTRLLV